MEDPTSIIETQPIALMNIDNEANQYENMLQKIIDLGSEKSGYEYKPDFFKHHLQKMVNEIYKIKDSHYNQHKSNIQNNIKSIKGSIDDDLPLELIEKKIRDGIAELTFQEKFQSLSFNITMIEIEEFDQPLKSLRNKCEFNRSTHQLNGELQIYRVIVAKYVNTLTSKINQVIQYIEDNSNNKIKIKFVDCHSENYIIDFENVPNDNDRPLYRSHEFVIPPCMYCTNLCTNRCKCSINCTTESCDQWCESDFPQINHYTYQLTHYEKTHICYFPCFYGRAREEECTSSTTHDTAGLRLTEFLNSKIHIKLDLTLKKIPGPNIKINKFTKSDLVSLYSTSSLPCYQEIGPDLPPYELIESKFLD